MLRRLPPLARATLAFLVGVVLALRLPSPTRPLVPVATAGVAGIVLLLRRTGSAAPLLGMAAVGLAVGQAAALHNRSDCRLHLPDGARVRVQGTLEALPASDGASRLRFETMHLGGRQLPCTGSIRVRLDAAAGAVPGAAVTGRGRWWAFPREGAWPRPARHAGTLMLDSIRFRSPEASSARDPLLAVRGGAQERLRRLLGARSALAEALLLAERDGLDPTLRDRFARAGLVHVLAISGLHVGLIAGVLLLLGRLARLSPRVTTLSTIAATLAYVGFLGAPVAATRAALQISLLLVAHLVQRPSEPFALLAAAALILVVADPLVVLSPGFQLSFAGVAGLLLLRRPVLEALPGRAPRFIRDGVAASIAATAATAPIAALHFGRVAPVAVVANIAAVPLVAAAVPSLAAALALSFVLLPAAELVAGAAGLLLAGLDAVASVAAAIPAGHAYVPRDDVLGWIAAAAVALALLRRMRSLRAVPRRWVAALAAAALLVVWPLVAGRMHGDALEIHAIDVGQGDAVALRSPAGRWMLVDAGPRTASYDAGRARVVPFLLSRSVRRLDALILTHPDADHIGGAQAVAEVFDVDAILEPGLPVGTSLYRELLGLARRDGIRWIAARPGRELRWDGVRLRFLAPSQAMVDAAEVGNNVSVVFHLTYGRFTALFLGDAPAEVERMLVREYGGRLRSTVLKVAHHGSATSTSQRLLAAASPELAVVSVGRRNRYGHPHPLVLRRLERSGSRILRTDRDGTITIRVRPDGAVRVGSSR